MRTQAHRVIALLLIAATTAQARQESPNEAPAPIAIRSALAIPSVGRYGRAPFQRDPIQAAIARGEWKWPATGDEVIATDGSKKAWRQIDADKDGWLGGDDTVGGYVAATVDSSTARVAMLVASGHAMVYVNGTPRIGDVYSLGFVRIPIELREGRNELLFHVARGRVKAELQTPTSALFIAGVDTTLPDLLSAPGSGDGATAPAGVIVVNASTETQGSLVINAEIDGMPLVSTPLPQMPPCSLRKMAIDVPFAAVDGKKVKLRLTLEVPCRGAQPHHPHALDTREFELTVRGPEDMQRRTFRSEIDGSVQYYAVRRATESDADTLLLTLHGASVEASGQCAAYAPKPRMHIVAPTNRRPFGFDWEDWGRLDMLEVLNIASAELSPKSVCLSGHSMGGHGTWINGLTFPDRFAAVAPSAGWVSFASYAGGAAIADETGVAGMLKRAAAPSDTLTLLDNARGRGIYILHGDADDNVPVDQARTMRGELGKFHSDFCYYERPGAGHWWGNECVDWPPLIDFLQRRPATATALVTHVNFTTASPHVSPRCHWATIARQQTPLKPSKIDITLAAADRTFRGSTVNVAVLRIDLSELSRQTSRENGKRPLVAPDAPIRVELDDVKLDDIAWPSGDVPAIWLTRDGDQWRLTEKPAPRFKNPERYGTFKDAFRGRFCLVYGSNGTAEENAWAAAKAQYDAEAWWYRGNGAVDVYRDDDFLAQHLDEDRNVILYGHAEMNRAWQSVIDESCPIAVRRGRVTIGAKTMTGEDLACLMIFPRKGSESRSVGVIAGSGLPGSRTLDRMPIFLSGVALPDFTVFTTDALSRGEAAIRAIGFFAADWSLGDDVVFQD